MARRATAENESKSIIVCLFSFSQQCQCIEDYFKSYFKNNKKSEKKYRATSGT